MTTIRHRQMSTASIAKLKNLPLKEVPEELRIQDLKDIIKLMHKFLDVEYKKNGA